MFRFIRIGAAMFALFIGIVLLTPSAQANSFLEGWWGHYFTTDIPQGTPAIIRQDPYLKFDWGWGPARADMPSDFWSARWISAFNAAETGTYRITVQGDDGFRVFVNHELVMDAWWHTPGRTEFVDIELHQGRHPIEVEYHDQTQQADISFQIHQIDAAPANLGVQYVGVVKGDDGRVTQLPNTNFTTLRYGQELPPQMWFTANAAERNRIDHNGLIYRPYWISNRYVPGIREAGIEVVDGSTDEVLDRIVTPGLVISMSLDGENIIAGTSETSRYFPFYYGLGVSVVNVSNPSNIYTVASYSPDGADRALFGAPSVGFLGTIGTQGSLLVLAYNNDVVTFVDMSDPLTPRKTGQMGLNVANESFGRNYNGQIHIAGDHVFVPVSTWYNDREWAVFSK